MMNLGNIKNLIFIILIININYGCSQSTKLGTMKWISKYDFFDLYKKNISNGNFGPETGLKLTKFKFLNDKTIFLAGSKDLLSFYNKPGSVAVLFISKDIGKTYQEILFSEENIIGIIPTKDYTLVETNSNGYSPKGKNVIYILNNNTLAYSKIDEYSSNIDKSYDQFDGKYVVISNSSVHKVLDVFTKEEYELPNRIKGTGYKLEKKLHLTFLQNNEIIDYDIVSKNETIKKKLSKNYDFLSISNDEILLAKANLLKTKITVYDINEKELYTETEKTNNYYRYKNFVCFLKETRPYVTINYSYDYGKNWYQYHTKEFFTTIIKKGFYKDKYILLDIGNYNKNDNSHILVGEFEK